jgi:hypothetical protein
MRDIGGRERESGRATSAAQQRIEIEGERLQCWQRAESKEREHRAGKSGKMKINGGKKKGWAALNSEA